MSKPDRTLTRAHLVAAVYKGQLDPRNLYEAFRALHDMNG